jgi:hypothetical protein
MSSVRYVYSQVEERGLRPESVADRYDLDLADVYAALTYYHRNPEVMGRVEKRRERLSEKAAEMTTLTPPHDRLGRYEVTYRLLLDENVEHEVTGRLEALRHDVEHVDSVPEFGKGASDSDLAAFSLTADRTIVMHGDDFVEDVPPEEYRAVLFFEDDTLPAKAVADIVHSMAVVHPHEEVRGLQKTGREWL